MRPATATVVAFPAPFRAPPASTLVVVVVVPHPPSGSPLGGTDPRPYEEDLQHPGVSSERSKHEHPGAVPSRVDDDEDEEEEDRTHVPAPAQFEGHSTSGQRDENRGHMKEEEEGVDDNNSFPSPPPPPPPPERDRLCFCPLYSQIQERSGPACTVILRPIGSQVASRHMGRGALSVSKHRGEDNPCDVDVVVHRDSISAASPLRFGNG